MIAVLTCIFGLRFVELLPQGKNMLLNTSTQKQQIGDDLLVKTASYGWFLCYVPAIQIEGTNNKYSCSSGRVQVIMSHHLLIAVM